MANFQTLAELAAWYGQQGDLLAHPRQRVTELLEHQDSARLFQRMIDNRTFADPSRLTLRGPLPPEGPGLWCERHGYRCISSQGVAGVTAQRGDEPPIGAFFGETLVWNGEQITVEPAAW